MFIASEQPLELGVELPKEIFDIDIPIPDYAMRKTIWQQYLTVTFSEEDVSALANKFSVGQIKDAFVSAQKLAVLHGARRNDYRRPL